MTIFYLILAVLLKTGDPATTLAFPFSTLEACTAAGHEASVELLKDDTVDRAAWKCDPVDFEKVDPAPAPKHIPGKNEA